MAGVVDEENGEDGVLIVKDIETAVVLPDTPKVRVIQPQHGADQNLVDHLMGYYKNSLILVAGHVE